MSRIFISHAAQDSRAATALAQWLSEQEPQLAGEIHLDIGGQRRWKRQLLQSNSRCEAVICLLSHAWEASQQCRTEYRTAEGLGKQILCARLEKLPTGGITSEWQRCDLFADGPQTEIGVSGGPSVFFNTAALYTLRKAIEGSGTGPENFDWPPDGDPDRAPYRGWEPLEVVDAAVFYGRDAAIVRGLDGLRVMRQSGVKSLFVVLGPSGSGKSSFLRAGLIPRLQREDRRFSVLGIVRPERDALTGKHGLAAAIHTARRGMKLTGVPLGELKKACTDPARIAALLSELRTAAAERVADSEEDAFAPTLVLPLDQAEELFAADAGAQAESFLSVIAEVLALMNAAEVGLIVAATIRTDRYEAMQDHPALDGIDSVLFNECKPMPPTEFRKVIVGPASRSGEADVHVRMAPDLVNRLIEDASEGADTLPLLSLTLALLYTDWADESGDELTLAQYQAMGAMQDVVNNEIEHVLASAPQDRPTSLALLRSAFIPWLATFTPDSDVPVRRVARYDDLPEASRPLIDALVARRLLVRGERDEEVVVEVALESLLRQWDDLSGWLRDERQHLVIADDIERYAAAWRGHGNDPAWLLTGNRLADAETVSRRTQFKDRLVGACEFLGASRQAEDDRLAADAQHQQDELDRARERQQIAEAHAGVLRKRSQTLRAVLVATAMAAVIAISGTVVAVTNLTNAHAARLEAQNRFYQATAHQLQAEAVDMLAGSVPGGDIRAFQELLAAAKLENSDAGPSLEYAAAQRSTTRKIINVGPKVMCVAFSPDGRTLATGDGDNRIRLWDAGTGQPVGAPLIGNVWPVLGLSFSPDGRHLASAGQDGTVRIWDVGAGREVGAPLSPGNGAGDGSDIDVMRAVAFSPDGHFLAGGGADGTVRLWDSRSGSLVRQFIGDGAGIASIAFSPDGGRLVSGNDDGAVQLWNATTGGPAGPPIPKNSDPVFHVVFSPDGRILAVASGDGSVHLWDAVTGAPWVDPREGHDGPVLSVAFSPDSARMATAGADHTIRLWDSDSGQFLGAALVGHTDVVRSVAFSPDGAELASASDDGTVRLWDANQPLFGGGGHVHDVAFSPDGLRLATAGDPAVRLWDAATSQPIGQPLTGHVGEVWSLAFSPDDRLLATGGSDGTIRLWDAHDGRPRGQVLVATSGVRDIAFSRDGLLASGNDDGAIQLWDLERGSEVGAPLTGHDDSVTGVAFSPDGGRLASSSYDTTLRLWDIKGRSQIDGPIEADTGELYSVAFSPDGHRLIAGTYDHKVWQWDADSRAEIGSPLVGHSDVVNDAVSSPDGRDIASGGRDALVRLWDAGSGRPIFEALDGHDFAVTRVAISPDGKRLASASEDTTVRLWPLDGNAEALCDKLTTNMTHAQWREWVSPAIPYQEMCPDLPTPPDLAEMPGVIRYDFRGLGGPMGVAVDSEGSVYVADYDHARVVRRHAGGAPQRQLPFGDMNHAVNVTVDAAGSIYVTDQDNKRVLELSSDLQTVRTIEFPDATLVFGVAVDPAGSVYVSDTHGGRVFELAAGSTTPVALPLPGLDNPRGLALDSAGNLYIADGGNNRILKLAPGASEATVLPFGLMSQPNGVAVDSAGNVYVTDTLEDRVLKLPVGWQTPTELEGRGLLRSPTGIAVAADGSLVVSDTTGNLVVNLPSG